MGGRFFRAPLVAAAFALLGGSAFATSPTLIDCNSSSTALATFAFASGGIYGIAGNCLGDVTITADNVTLANFDNSGTDTITGAVTVSGARNVTLESISGGSLVIAGTGSDAGGEPAGLHVTGGGAVAVSGLAIENTEENGVLVDQGSVLAATNVTVIAAGQAGTIANGNGLVVQDGATAILQANTPGGTSFSGNAGYDILAVTGNVILGGSAGVVLAGSGLGAISASAGAHLRINGVSTSGSNAGTIAAVGTQPTIYVAGSSSLLLQSATVKGTQAAVPVIQISTGSSFLSGGGNMICFFPAAACDASGFAVQIDHGSSMAETNGTAADTIVGAGMVQEQSSMELGTGAATPSTWLGTVTAQQNSSFRMSGGMAISGQLVLDQGSNGFFNNGNGGASNGLAGGVNCVFASIPASHVSGPGKIVPPVATGTVFATVTPPTCLAF